MTDLLYPFCSLSIRRHNVMCDELCSVTWVQNHRSPDMALINLCCSLLPQEGSSEHMFSIWKPPPHRESCFGCEGVFCLMPSQHGKVLKVREISTCCSILIIRYNNILATWSVSPDWYVCRLLTARSKATLLIMRRLQLVPQKRARECKGRERERN